jgi:hypothetical protein
METTLLFWIELFTAWLLYLVVQASFINGIKFSAMGHTEIRPDGTEQDSEMILYPLSKFLLQKTYCKIFYTGDELKNRFAEIIGKVPNLFSANITSSRILFSSDDQYNYFLSALLNIKNAQKPFVEIDFDEHGFGFYKSYEQYRFSKYIRKPIIQCIICMGSFYGLFTFLIPLLIITHFKLVVLPAYLVNTFMLAYVNKYLYKKAE